MIEISTHATSPLCNGKVQSDIQNECSADNLGEEDQRFFFTIKQNLDRITRHPQSTTIDRILTYSKSL